MKGNEENKAQVSLPHSTHTRLAPDGTKGNMKLVLFNTLNRRIFVLIIILATLFYGCTKGKKLGEYLLGDLKNENPYTGNETLIFLDNTGDSIVFIGDGRTSELFHFLPDNPNNYNYYVNEIDSCYFTQINSNYKLGIRLCTHLDWSAEMWISLGPYRCTKRLPLIDNVPFIDSIEVNGKYYYTVFKVKWDNSNEFFYYNTTDGFIKFDRKNGDTWELMEIIPE